MGTTKSIDSAPQEEALEEIAIVEVLELNDKDSHTTCSNYNL